MGAREFTPAPVVQARPLLPGQPVLQAAASCAGRGDGQRWPAWQPAGQGQPAQAGEGCGSGLQARPSGGCFSQPAALQPGQAASAGFSASHSRDPIIEVDSLQQIPQVSLQQPVGWHHLAALSSMLLQLSLQSFWACEGPRPSVRHLWLLQLHCFCCSCLDADVGSRAD